MWPTWAGDEKAGGKCIPSPCAGLALTQDTMWRRTSLPVPKAHHLLDGEAGSQVTHLFAWCSHPDSLTETGDQRYTDRRARSPCHCELGTSGKAAAKELLGTSLFPLFPHASSWSRHRLRRDECEKAGLFPRANRSSEFHKEDAGSFGDPWHTGPRQHTAGKALACPWMKNFSVSCAAQTGSLVLLED